MEKYIQFLIGNIKKEIEEKLDSDKYFLHTDSFRTLMNKKEILEQLEVGFEQWETKNVSRKTDEQVSSFNKYQDYKLFYVANERAYFVDDMDTIKYEEGYIDFVTGNYLFQPVNCDNRFLEEVFDNHDRKQGSPRLLSVGVCQFADSKEELKAEKGNYYEEPIFKHASYKKWIYKGKDITLIICDSQTDGMWWFQIFDNAKRLPMEMKK